MFVPTSTYNWFGVVFTDDSGNRYVLNSDKTWNYLSLAPGSSSNNNPGIYRDLNGGNYFIYIDPAFNNTRYVKNPDGTKTYLTGFPTQVSGTPISYTDALGNTYTLYSDPQGNKYVTYSDPKGKYYLNNSGNKVYLTNAQLTPTNNGGATIIPTTPTGTGSPVYVFTDSNNGSRYILSPNGVRTYLTLTSTSGNTQTYTDPQGNRYTITKDPTTNNLWYQLTPTTKEFLTSYPSTVSGTPLTFNDTLGTVYNIYSDPQGNKYVVYSDSMGPYYLNANGNKVYLNGGQPSTGSGAPVYIFTDSTGGNRYILNSTGDRQYLTLSSTQGNTQVYTDSLGNKYSVVKDPTTGALSYQLTTTNKEFLTGYPTTTSGQPLTLNDSLGTQYGIYSDPQGNKYIVYTDPLGTYYLNNNGNKVYLNQQPTATTGLGSNTYVFIDSTGGNRYILSPNGVRTYLTLTSTQGNTQTYTDPSGNRYTITRDPTTGVLTTTVNGVKEYLNTYPSTVSGSPITFADSLGVQYGIYSDPQGNKYVVYNDPSGSFYLSNTLAKTYLPLSPIQGATTQNGSPVLVFTDSTGGNRYILGRNNVRTYLALTSTSGNTQVYTDPQGNRYTLTRDPVTNNIVTPYGNVR